MYSQYISFRSLRMRDWFVRVVGVIATGVLFGITANSQIIHIDDAKTQYTNAVPQDTVNRLQADIDLGKAKLKFDPKFGYLPAVLKALHLSTTSQVVVFSKTSVQKEIISPENPRSLYFSDSTYVGYVSGAKALEICSSEPYLGGVYYTLLQREVDKPRFFRTIDACLECHVDKGFSHLPQHIMYSSYCALDGSVLPDHKPMLVSDSTPLSERFGGWFVTGNTSGQKHLGNYFAENVKNREHPEHENRPFGSLKSLSKVLEPPQVLTPYSDIVALMVFGHQQEMLNLIAGATYQTNTALALETLKSLHTLNSSTSRPSSAVESTDYVISRVCEPVVAGLLFAGEAKLSGAISGDSGYAQYFAAIGPKDRRGRSLRTFDLKRRLFRYPCSYLIYSDSFRALPALAKRYVYRRLWDILLGRKSTGKFNHLTAKDRTAIIEILTDTVPGFAANRQP